MIDSKNQMIRSMRSYAEGGSTEDSCMEEYTSSDGKKRRRRKSGCGKTTKFRSSSRSGGGGGGALGPILGAGAAVAGGLGIKKMLDKNKKGGSVKTLLKKQDGGVSPADSTKRKKAYDQRIIMKDMDVRCNQQIKDNTKRNSDLYKQAITNRANTDAFNKMVPNPLDKNKKGGIVKAKTKTMIKKK